MSFIRSLQLTNFRSYGQAALSDPENGFVVLHGPNGAGKTNILEAVSLFSPGRGLRGARITDMRQNTAQGVWSVAGKVETAYGTIQMGTGQDPEKNRRIVRINGETMPGQSALAEYLSCVWMTPQMDRLFLEGPASRRRFLDRLIFAFDPGHAGRVTRYENAMRQRSKLLQDGNNDDAWLDGLEAQMAETGVSLAAARLDFSRRLQRAIDGDEDAHIFPRANIRCSGTLEALLRDSPALEVEEMFQYQLRETRGADAVTGGAATGPHKSDLDVVYTEKNMPADQCSTGEQKALLIGLILAHSRLIKAEKGAPPILLLDEVAAHLDEDRRAALYDVLQKLGGQVWMTGTDAALFETLEGRARFFKVEQGHITSLKKSKAA